MANAKFLAFDLGASSGRAIIGQLNDKLSLEEIHRFNNHPVQIMGHQYWDLLGLFQEMKNSLEAVAQKGHHDLCGIGVDTWGVDFGLVGRDNVLLASPYAYRDQRTDGMMEKAFEFMPREKIYQLTGNQFLQFNTIFQLYSMVVDSHPVLAASERLLFMPDLVNLLMTGERTCEYSIASTSQLLNAASRTWEPSIFAELALPIDIMGPVIPSGTVIGKLLPELSAETGLGAIDVIAPACHDTASAVAAVPASGDGWAYLSSGTWSLMGVEIPHPIINDNSLQNNFTNEGGVNGTIRFLRNIMGMWLLQGCMKSWERKGDKKSYEQILAAAAGAKPFKCIIDPDDRAFLNPADMPAVIIEYCRQHGQPAPQNEGELVRCILESLALKYRCVMEKMNGMIPSPVKKLHIVGGGSQNQLLNQFTANAIGLPVLAGPVEATAIGNILVQAVAQKVISSIEDGRQMVAKSYPLQSYEPQNTQQWDETYEQNKHLFI
jgi:rhamnulokinase